MTEQRKNELKTSSNEMRRLVEYPKESTHRNSLTYSLYHASANTNLDSNYLRPVEKNIDVHKSLTNISNSLFPFTLSNLNYDSRLHVPHSTRTKTLLENKFNIGMYGSNVTTVYMTLLKEYCQQRTLGTQATASINKCFQVYNNSWHKAPSSFSSNSNYFSTSTMSTLPYRDNPRRIDRIRFSEVYFFGRKKDESKQKGMGQKESKTYLCKSGQTTNMATKSSVHQKDSKLSTSRTSLKSTASGRSTSPPKKSSQTGVKKVKGSTTGTNPSKSVSIKEDKPRKPCPALGSTKGDMMATVSHIRIGPKEPCPVHGKEPCQGPKCIVAASGEEQGPVKVTNVTNPRRGVFELVIRKMTGAPLAKNELMLEWTPPPSRPPICSTPCSIPCTSPGPCYPPKCKMIVYRPSPCSPKCTRKKPCMPIPCRPLLCKSCCRTSCWTKPCRPPPQCFTCRPTPCKIPCSPITCNSPCISCCKSSPCLRPCPVGRKRTRRARSQPKIRTHRKRISPCCNRSKACPVVRCRSVSGPCISCRAIPPYCPPRRCCSVTPCKPIKCCRSICSTCCG